MQIAQILLRPIFTGSTPTPEDFSHPSQHFPSNSNMPASHERQHKTTQFPFLILLNPYSKSSIHHPPSLIP